MRVLLRQQQIGEVAGGVAAGAGVTAAGAPELVPLGAPAGAMAGREAEKAIRGVIKKDNPAGCEDLGDLKRRWDVVMDELLRNIDGRYYESAEKNAAKLIELDVTILRSVNCKEAAMH